MDLRQKIERMIELMNIPACEQVLTLEMERLERMMEEDIHLYRNLKHGFRHQTRSCLQVADPGPGGASETYRIELHRQGGGDWRVTMVEPPAPDEMPAEALVPLEVIHLMSSFRTDPGKVRRHTWSFHTLDGVRTFRVEFTNFSDRHIIGTICELDRSSGEAPEPWGRGGIVVIDAADPGCLGRGDEYRYNELIYYMEKYPQVKEHVFSDFYFRVKPKLDKRGRGII